MIPASDVNLLSLFTGTLTSGKKFDSSRDRGSPFVFTIGVGQVRYYLLNCKELSRCCLSILSRLGHVFSLSSSFHFLIVQVIKGWDEGVATMKIGERAELTCSPGKIPSLLRFNFNYNFICRVSCE